MFWIEWLLCWIPVWNWDSWSWPIPKICRVSVKKCSEWNIPTAVTAQCLHWQGWHSFFWHIHWMGLLPSLGINQLQFHVSLLSGLMWKDLINISHKWNKCVAVWKISRLGMGHGWYSRKMKWVWNYSVPVLFRHMLFSFFLHLAWFFKNIL